MRSATNPHTHHPQNSRWRRWLRNFGTLAIILGGAWLITGYLSLAFLPVRTGSMVPAFYPADMVIGVSPQVKKPDIGDVVVAEPYFTEGGDKLPAIAHRIIGSQRGGWETQGDANPNPDGWIVRDVDISHVVVGSIPMRYAKDPRLIAAIVGISALVMFWPKGEKSPPGGMFRPPHLQPLRQRSPGQADHARTGRHRTH